MAAHMRTSRAGLDLIKLFEGYRPRYEPLPDGRWIIGYGHVRAAREGSRVSELDAEAILREYDLPKFERVVRQSVLAPLNQNEFDALVSLAFNIGETAFAGSDVVAALNGGNRLTAASAFDGWRQAEIGGRIQLVDALVRRRAAEKSLFLKTVGPMPIAASGVYQALQDPALQSVVPRLPISPPSPSATHMQPSNGAGQLRERSATEEAADAVRRQMEKILHDEADTEPLEGVHQLAAQTDGASPDEITAAISALVDDSTPTVRKSVWPQHQELSPPPAYARELTKPTVPNKSKPNGGLNIDHIDDLEEVDVDPDQIAKVMTEHVTTHTEHQRGHFIGILPHALLALLGTILAGYGGLKLFNRDPGDTADAALVTYMPGFLILLGLSLFVVMGYYCLRGLRNEE